MKNRLTSIWLHCNLPRPDSAFRLICFPHAGGTAQFFKTWSNHLQEFEVYAVKYPGRADRIEDPLPTDLIRLSEEIAEVIKPLTDLPLVLFGHSLGASVALETARTLEYHHIPVAHLFTSGSRDGDCPSKGKFVNEDDDTICQQLVKMGSIDFNLANDPIFRELMLPAIRSDGKMFHEYNMKLTPILKCPISTIVGDLDKDANIRPWRNLSSTYFEEIGVTGDHFYLTYKPPFEELRRSLKLTVE